MVEPLQDSEKSFFPAVPAALLQQFCECGGSGFGNNFHCFCGKLDLCKALFLFYPDSLGVEVWLKTGANVVVRMGYRIAVYGSFAGQ